MEKNLTTGSVGRQLIGFSLPYLLSYLLQTLYGMADLFIIGPVSYTHLDVYKRQVLGCVWCILPLSLAECQCFRRRSTR